MLVYADDIDIIGLRLSYVAEAYQGIEQAAENLWQPGQPVIPQLATRIPKIAKNLIPGRMNIHHWICVCVCVCVCAKGIGQLDEEI